MVGSSEKCNRVRTTAFYKRDKLVEITLADAVYALA